MRDREQDEAPYGRSPLTGRPYTSRRVEGAKHVIDHELHLSVIDRITAMGREAAFRSSVKKIAASPMPSRDDQVRAAVRRAVATSAVRAKQFRLKF